MCASFMLFVMATHVSLLDVLTAGVSRWMFPKNKFTYEILNVVPETKDTNRDMRQLFFLVNDFTF